MKKLKDVFTLFFTMFKIGLFTFGGGYAMIAIIEREIVERKKWIDHNLFLDIVAIAESTPGPIAINMATYVGYRVAGIFGSIFATLGIVLPSFLIIFAISFVFDAFLSLQWVKYAFMGIQACVAFLILNAGIKLLKHLKLNVFNTILFVLTALCILILNLFSIKLSSIIYILIGGVLGVSIYLANYIKNKSKQTTIQQATDTENIANDSDVQTEKADNQNVKADNQTVEQDVQSNKGGNQ